MTSFDDMLFICSSICSWTKLQSEKQKKNRTCGANVLFISPWLSNLFTWRVWDDPFDCGTVSGKTT